MSQMRKLKGLAAASLRLKALNDNPYFRDLKVSFLEFSERSRKMSENL